MKYPYFKSYGEYSSDNYGTHSLVFTDADGNDFYFSYSTLVAFRPSLGSLVVRKNEWGTTTGKHLNKIDGGNKQDRLNSEDFRKKYFDTFHSVLAD